MRPAPKVIPPILLCWPMISDTNIGGMAVEVEPSHQYFITFCCCETDGSRGAVWHNGVWHGSAYEANLSNWIYPCGKSYTHWHSSTLAYVYGDQTVDVSTVGQWVACFSSGDSNSGSSLLVQLFTSVACRLLFITG